MTTDPASTITAAIEVSVADLADALMAFGSCRCEETQRPDCPVHGRYGEAIGRLAAALREWNNVECWVIACGHPRTEHLDGGCRCCPCPSFLQRPDRPEWTSEGWHQFVSLGGTRELPTQ